MARKAANGAGSLYKDVDYGKPDKDGKRSPRPGGVWIATFWMPGEARPRKVRGKTQQEAIAKRQAAVALAQLEARLSSSFRSDMTVGELASWWMRNVIEPDSIGPDPTIRLSTIKAYQTTVDRFGSLSLVKASALTTDVVQVWKADLLRSGLAARSVNASIKSLRRVMSEAVTHGFQATNPLHKVKGTKVATTQRLTLTDAERERLVQHLDNHRHGAVIALLFVDGLRVSEALGLGWADVDFEAGTADIRRAAHDVDKIGLVLGKPKTEDTLGIKFLAPGTVARLRAHKARQAADRLAAGGEWPTHRYDGAQVDLCFTTTAGGIVRRQTIDTVLRRAAPLVGLDPAKLGTHTGRRGHDTRLYQTGMSKDDIALIGKKSSETVSTYVQSAGERTKEVADRAHRVMDVPLRPVADA